MKPPKRVILRNIEIFSTISTHQDFVVRHLSGDEEVGGDSVQNWRPRTGADSHTGHWRR